MKVFYTASYKGKKSYQKYYDAVLNAILKVERDVISPELGNYLKLIADKEKMKIRDLRSIHYSAIRKGIELSDIVIIEISLPGFQLGHEATLAMQDKKHVLCLSIHQDMSIKIKNRYFHGAKYNVENIDEIVGKFLTKYRKEIYSERFNMLLTKSQIKYLEKMGDSIGMNKSEYLRELIDRDRGLK
ncbi:hypothetical protein HYV12_01250 [Candidatus Dojkabacteria bacterium]|nr:hypothetical protein [Candidatus Dojkabacteria bacterium]